MVNWHWEHHCQQNYWTPREARDGLRSQRSTWGHGTWMMCEHEGWVLGDARGEWFLRYHLQFQQQRGSPKTCLNYLELFFSHVYIIRLKFQCFLQFIISSNAISFFWGPSPEGKSFCSYHNSLWCNRALFISWQAHLQQQGQVWCSLRRSTWYMGSFGMLRHQWGGQSMFSNSQMEMEIVLQSIVESWNNAPCTSRQEQWEPVPH